MSAAARQFPFRPDLTLVIRANAHDLEHFEAEYGPSLAWNGGEADAVVSVVGRGAPAPARYKSVRWGVAVTESSRPLQAEVCLQGWPRNFGLSLVQGYFVEPLLSLVAPAAGYVLLPAAGFSIRGRTFVLMGRSRVGKSSVAARVLAAGHVFLGDDQVLLDASRAGVPLPPSPAGSTPISPNRTGRIPVTCVLPSEPPLFLRKVVRSGTRGRRPARPGAVERVGSPVQARASRISDRCDRSRGSWQCGRRVPKESITAEAALEHASELLQAQRSQLVQALPALKRTVERVAASRARDPRSCVRVSNDGEAVPALLADCSRGSRRSGARARPLAARADAPRAQAQTERRAGLRSSSQRLARGSTQCGSVCAW